MIFWGYFQNFDFLENFRNSDFVAFSRHYARGGGLAITIKCGLFGLLKNTKFCKKYETNENYNYEVTYEISDMPNAVLTKAFSEKSLGEQKVNE